MSVKTLFHAISVLVMLALSTCMTPTALAAGGHGGGGGGHGGGGFGGGGYHGGSFGGHAYSGFSGYSAARSFASPAFHGGQFAHTGNFAGDRGFNSFAGRGFNHANFGDLNGRYANYFNRGYHNRGFYGGYGGWGWGWGGGWPWWYGGWDWGWGYPYAYSLYNYYPYSDYSYDYNPYAQAGSSYVYPYAQTDYGENSVVNAVPQTAPPVAADEQGGGEAERFYSEGRAYFLQGDYQNALKMAAHAEIDAPTNAKVHELLSLALFASGNYPAAASEAHAAMAMGGVADWNDLYGYYDDESKYTSQLRALEKAARDNPKSAADRFLLGYQYLMIRARDNAKAEFAKAVELTPKDRLAEHYLAELKANSPLTPPQTGAPPQTVAKPQGQTL
jgi:hypothetical protein